MAETYDDRDSLLVRLGYASYEAYLESPLWEQVRRMVLERDHGRCLLCNRSAGTAHHLNYRRETMLGTCLNGLASICGRCHCKVEFSADGVKLTLKEAQVKYLKLWKRRPLECFASKDSRRKARNKASNRRLGFLKGMAYRHAWMTRRSKELTQADWDAASRTI